MGIFVEASAVEDGDNALVLHVSILYDGIEDDLSVCIDVLQLLPGDGLQELRHGEDGACREPTAHVVSRDVVEHRLARNYKDVVLQLLQVADTHDFLTCLRISEDEVAEAHVLLEDVAQVDAHLLRIFIDEMEPFSLSLLTVLTLGTFHDERHKLVARTNGPQQLQSSLGVFLNARQAFAGTRRAVGGLHGEAHIADDAEHIIMELLVDGPCLLVATCQHHFWSAAHTHRCRVRVQGLC